MRTHFSRLMRYLGMACTSVLLGTGCAGSIAREIEVFFSAAANPFAVRDSFLVEAFGLGILRLFN